MYTRNIWHSKTIIVFRNLPPRERTRSFFFNLSTMFSKVRDLEQGARDFLYEYTGKDSSQGTNEVDNRKLLLFASPSSIAARGILLGNFQQSRTLYYHCIKFPESWKENKKKNEQKNERKRKKSDSHLVESCRPTPPPMLLL